ncbi:hypothetical protein GGR58DRAFT_503995 [Xylaria digitata]|nr:hypothetical protein GGR58DRAFT_503995 [Xylaria digitata]
MSSKSMLASKKEPVAIVGMGCRSPGGVHSPSEMWDLLRNKKDAWREFAEPRFSSDGLYHPNADRSGTVSTKGGFLVDEDPRLFDHAFFGMTGLEVETMDRSQRKLLEVVYEAFENAGESWESVSGSKTGLFIGNFSLDHWIVQARDWDFSRPYATTGAATSILANRISYIFNLQGPSLAIDTACSSSMYAIHLVVNGIRNGDCDSAIVAASNWLVDPSLQIALNKLGALSPTSRCHTFDASADGYARGEGFAALFLKGLTELTGDNGTVTRPSAAGQEAVIRKAYEDAGDLSFSDTTYFECHGTGTPVGDPIEVSAVGNVFASTRSGAPEDRLRIGSVKTNLGHTEGASAIAAVMKVVLSLEAEEIPPSFGVEMLNPNINFDAAQVEVVRELTPWPKGKTRRASINSFGFGGANGHCIIDHVNEVMPTYVKIYRAPEVNGHGLNEPAANDLNDAHKSKKPRNMHKANRGVRQRVLLPFSAHNKHSLKSNIGTLSTVISQWPLADIAYTMGCRRSKLGQRSYRVVDKTNIDEGLRLSKSVFAAPAQPAQVGFVFTGQGAQWHSTGAGLFEYRVFQASIEFLDYVLGHVLSTPHSWTLQDILSGNCDENFVQTPEISQVACTAIQIGMVDLLVSWPVRPVGVSGHSSGEIAAAYASGRITAAEAITAAYFRGHAVSRNSTNGAMLAVSLGPKEAAEYLIEYEGVEIAAINSPGSYWHGIHDGRTESPFLSLESWHSALKAAGFSGAEITLEDYPSPDNTTTTMMSVLAGHALGPNKSINDGSGSKKAPGIDLVYDDEEATPLLLQVVQKEIESRGLLPRLIPFNEAQDRVRKRARVIAFLSGKSLLLVPDDIHFRAFQHIAQNAASLVCLTSCGIVKGRDPDGTITAGLLRTIGSENPITRYLSIDIDAEKFNTNEPELVQCILDQESAIQQGYIDETEARTEDREFVWQNGCLYVSRVVQDPGFQGYSEVTQIPGTCGTSRTRLGSDPSCGELWRPLPPDWVDVKVVAVGLNWKDVGLTSGRFDGSNLSSEYTGIIAAIGSAVTDLAVGDHVYGTRKGHFGNFIRQKAETTHRLQTGDNLVEMATMPLVYMTAVYAFENLAHLQRGQTVLIQSATGGLGLAAIQLARAKGAEVFATVGTTDKAKFLVDKMKFIEGRYAVCVNKGLLGHIIDVGRIDVTDAKAIGLELFQMGATFSSFDLSLLLDSDSSLGRKLLQTVDKHYRNGSIGPIRPFRAIDVSELDQALLEFSTGTASIVTCMDPAALAAKKREEEGAGIPSTTVPRWYRDGRVSHVMRAFDDARRHFSDADTDQATDDGGGKSTVARLRWQYNQAIKAGPEGVANTADFVKRAITSTVAEMLFIDPLGVNPSKSVAGHGVDSLIAAELRNWFHQAFGINISMLELLDARTSISELSESIASAAVKTGVDVTAAQN